jgi:ligand-binding sensor domain-containing protein/DNA-binding CsgD family transcriptional regulator
MKRIAGLFLSLFLLGGPGLSADFFPGRFHRFERLTPRTATISMVGISSISQDKEGFLWLGTSAGLARYDGYRFVFFPAPADARSSSAPTAVYAVTPGHNGDLWLGTNGQGLLAFSKDTQTFARYLSDDIVLAVQEDARGDLWIGTRSHGLYRLDQATRSFTRIPLGPGADVIWDVLADRKGNIWVGTLETGLFKIDPATGNTRNYRFSPDDPQSLGSDTVWTIFEDAAGAIWAGTKNGGLDRYEPETEGFTQLYGDGDFPRDLASQTITAIAEDRAGRLWLGTASGGLRIWDPGTGDYVLCRHDPQDPETLGDDNVTSLFRDVSGIIWVGTVRGGLNKCLADQVKFPHFKHDPSNPGSLGHNDVRALWADGAGTLWVGTKSNLERIDGATGRVTHTLPSSWPGANASTGGAVQAVAGDDRGGIWLGTESDGLVRYDPLTGLMVHYLQEPENPNSLTNNTVNALWIDKGHPDVLWVGTNRGLNRLQTRTNRWTRFFNDPGNAAGLSGNIIRAIFEDEQGFLWVGTSRGLNRLDKATGRCETFTSRLRDPPGTNLSSNSVNCIHVGDDGLLWVGTDSGLDRLDRTTGEWRNFAHKDGLGGEVVYGILEDAAGALWVSTNRGLSKLDQEAGRITNFGLRDGLQGHAFNRGAYVKAPDGRMFFGGTNGFNGFDPAEVRKNTYVPPIVWTAFYRNNQEVMLPGSTFTLRNVALTYKTGLATFEFAALLFTAPELNTFAYRLEPRDAEWISLLPEHQVSLYDIGRGRYTLRVKAANPDGVWNEEGIAVELTVLPPFWRTWWFGLIAAAFLLSGTALAVRAWRKIKSAPRSLGENQEGVIETYDLTAREQEILRFVLQGARNKDIEKKLFISASTVRNHISNIYQKLGVRNRLELINRIGRDAREAGRKA